MNRAARSMRRGSSENDTSGSSGVRRRLSARSLMPLNGSTSTRSGRLRAIAFTVKSRRDRSVSMSWPNLTSGLRDSGTYASALCVVISKRRPARMSPMVPNRLPWFHMASLRSATNSSISSGVASEVRSMSTSGPGSTPPGRPAMPSRTGPPTRKIFLPADLKRSAIGRVASRTERRRSGTTAEGAGFRLISSNAARWYRPAVEITPRTCSVVSPREAASGR